MKLRTALVSGLLFLGAMYAPLAAAQQQWSKTVAAPNVYTDNTENSSYFSQGGLLPSAVIVNPGVSWNVGSYTNGWVTQTVFLCYKPPVGAEACSDISNELTGSTTAFNGQPARGQFRVAYRLVGGTYPVYPSFYNTVTVTY
ncbi:hypothetical protein AGMMS50256_37540 [Betaproteobacteria bacterium]|nr:hypothetical protein AGMMS50256_37540 [Betaproteobacteria bacterium]